MKLLQIEQRSSEWYELRRDKLGASDIAKLMDGSKKEIYDLYLEKVTGKENFQTNAMKRGTELEPEALRIWNENMGLKCVPAVALHSDHDWLMASFDGYEAAREIVVEIKCPLNPLEKVEEHPYYLRWWWQVQTQLAVSNALEGFIFVYHEAGGTWTRVERNDAAIGRLIASGEEFYKRVVNFDAPEEEIETREDALADDAITRWRLTKDILEAAKSDEEEARAWVIEVSNGNSFICQGVSVQKLGRKGAVDYKAIPELRDVDLEQYRKPGAEYWRIT